MANFWAGTTLIVFFYALYHVIIGTMLETGELYHRVNSNINCLVAEEGVQECTNKVFSRGLSWWMVVCIFFLLTSVPVDIYISFWFLSWANLIQEHTEKVE